MTSGAGSGAGGDVASQPRSAPDVVVLPVEETRGSLSARALEFSRRVFDKADEDRIFFLAGAISFNVLVAVVPLLLVVVGIAGLILSSRFPEPGAVLMDLLARQVPAIGGDIDLGAALQGIIDDVLDRSAGFTVVGSALLVWFAARLVASLRISLRDVFDTGPARGIVEGKLFDMAAVLIGGLLLLVNVGVTTAIAAAQDFGVDLLGLEGQALTAVDRGVAFAVSFLSIWVLFLGVYRFVPARRIPWRTALIAATFAAVAHEMLKWGFGWYATDIANYRTTYGNLVTLAVLFLWIYYEAIVFILAGEVAQVSTMRRARRVKTRRALFGAEGGA